MKELFGIPMDTLAAVLAVLVAIVAGSLGALALRHRVLLKLGIRNLGRRRARSALIVVGLMLGTTIIAAALATGDTMSHTIRATATRQYGDTEEIVGGQRSGRRHRGRAGSRDGHRLLPREHGREGPARPRRQASHRRRHGRDPGGRRAPGPDPAPDRAERHALRARSGGHGRVRADSAACAAAPSRSTSCSAARRT